MADEQTEAAEQQAKPKKVMNHWSGLAILALLAFFNYLSRNMIYPLFDLIGKDLKIKEGKMGMLGSGFYGVYAFSAPVLGYLSDRVSRKNIIMMMLIAWTLSTVGSGLSPNFVFLLICVSLTGLGEGGYFPTALSLIGDFFGTASRGRAIAIMGASNTLGGATGLAAGGALGQAYGWRVPYVGAIVPGILLALILWVAFHEPARGGDSKSLKKEAPEGGRLKAYLRMVTSVPVMMIALASALAGYAMNGPNTFFAKFAKDKLGVSVKGSGMSAGAGYAATMIGQFGGGFLSDGLSKVVGSRPLLVAFAYLGAVPVFLGLPHVGAIGTATLLYALTQVGRGFAEPNFYGTILDSVSAEDRGAAQGFMLMLTFGGATISPTVTGFMIEKLGWDVAWYHLAITSALAGALGLFLFAWLRKQKSKAAA